ncbi:MAG: DUF1330 domain-containing protein [Alphaproteobacteria bacterium]|nr:MAG: DUF1330 domain-containing protein [Alphaproteobacteria bacterium]
MPKAYWIVHIDVSNPEGYKAYVAANAEPLRKYGAKFLVRGGQFENPEGKVRSRNVVLEFPDYATALACYNSPEYQRAIALRTPHSTGDVMIIEGYDGPQP